MTKWDYWLLAAAIFGIAMYIVSGFTGWMHYRMQYWEQQAIALSVGVFVGKASRIWLRKQN
jgi:hypothetical protein